MRHCVFVIALTACAPPQEVSPGAPQAKAPPQATPATSNGTSKTSGTKGPTGPTGPTGKTSGPATAAMRAHCEQIVACMTGVYATADQCLEEGLAYWGSCASRVEKLTTYSSCMLTAPCEDVHEPANTDCADEFEALEASPECPTEGPTGPTGTSGGNGDTDGMRKRCQLLIDCGLSSFATAQACMDKAMMMYGSCPKQLAAVEAYATCMLDVECSLQYSPASTPCGGLWNAMNAAPCH